MNPSSAVTETEKVKKGRKPKEKNYFAEREEHAVRMFLQAETWGEKNKIYDEFLHAPLDKMISSIIRRYKLYRKDMDFNDIHSDTHSFLLTKVDKFQPEKNKKAYSYFGTICKNYLMGQIIKDQKDQNRRISYEDISSNLENRPDLVYYMEYENVETTEVIDMYVEKLEDFIEKSDLNTNEIKLGYALVELLKNYERVFLGNDNNKFNKNVILLSIREMTNMSTKEVRSSIKKYRHLYYDFINKLSSE